jgi:hypothetical protein
MAILFSGSIFASYFSSATTGSAGFLVASLSAEG